MITWLKKTAIEAVEMTEKALNTPVPIGKTVLTVLVIEGVILLSTRKIKIIAVFS